jgi:hypothetical protein
MGFQKTEIYLLEITLNIFGRVSKELPLPAPKTGIEISTPISGGSRS